MVEAAGGHWLIVGQTESGKSTLAKRLCSEYRRSGISTVVLDPLVDPGFDASVRFREMGPFFEYVRNPKKCVRCAVFIDEAGMSLDKYAAETRWLTTTSRHHGHRVHIVAQRAVMVDPTIRSQCTTLAIFNVNSVDAKNYALDWNCDEIRNAPNLPKGHYILASRFQAARRFKLW